MTDDHQLDVKPAGRVLVLLDGSPISRSALEAAADIASARGAEVVGIFVEETNLLRSAGYGFAREVGASSGQIRPLDTSHLEARMQTLAREAGKVLQQVMAARGVHQALKRCRGQVVTEVLSLTRPDDLLILGRVGWSGGPGSMLGSTARSLAHRAPGEVLLWCNVRPRQQGRVVVLVNHDQGANHRAVDVGADLAQRYHQPLTVLVRTDSVEEQAITADLLAHLRRKGIVARVRLLPMASASAAIAALREEHTAHLVMSRGCRLFSESGADGLLDTMNLPITLTH